MARDDVRLAYELTKVTDPRHPPVPVWVERRLDEQTWPGELHGWAESPNGGSDGIRDLVVAERTGGGEYIGWSRPRTCGSAPRSSAPRYALNGRHRRPAGCPFGARGDVGQAADDGGSRLAPSRKARR
jgi:hypothetical protein